MAKKNESGYLSAKESRRISRENRKITDQFEKLHKRKNVPEEEFLTQMHDQNNSLEIENLHTYFFSDVGTVRAVDGVSFDVPIGKTVGVVGESGCGKSVTSLSIMQLLQRPQGQVVEGEIRLNLGNGKAYDITKTPIEQMQKLRGNYMSMIFQEPMTSLNPVFSVKKQLSEPFIIHQGMSKKEAAAKCIEMLKAVQIPNPEAVAKQYPHQLSGGMRQRVMIAMALACKPDILIADEPTTALDVTIQAQILRLMNDLQKENGTSIMFITHDLGVINEMADDVVVMYCGQVVEQAPARVIFTDCKKSHPYTEGLMYSIPRLNDDRKKLDPIPGAVPHPLDLPKGCKFAPRCKYCTQKCIDAEPELKQVAEGQFVRCFYPDKEERRSAEHGKIVVHY